MARILREPLVHFLFLGALLFVTYDIFNDDRGIGSNRIVIDDGVVASIVGGDARDVRRGHRGPLVKGVAHDD